jgi:tetratricopeptide (TPR) repeat protein
MKRVKFLGALLLSSWTLLAQTAIDDAKKSIVNENYAEAKKILNQYVLAEKDPNKQAEAYYWLGESEYRNLVEEKPTEAMERAREQYNKGIILSKSNPQCQVGMGKLLLDAKNDKEAVKTFDAAIRNSKEKRFKEGHPETYSLIGESYLNGRYPNPELGTAYFVKARDILVNSKGGTSSAEDAKAAAAIYIRMGDACLAKGDAGCAMGSYESSLSKDPSNPEVYLKMAKIWSRAGKYDLGLERLNEGLKINDKYAPLYKDKVEVLLAMKKYNEVTPTLEKYVPLAGTDFDSRLRFVKFLSYQAKDYDRAITEAKRLLTDAPDYKSVYRWLAWSYFEKAAMIEKEKKQAPFGDDWKMLMEESNKASKALMVALPPDRLVYYDYEYAAKSAQRLGDLDGAMGMYKKVMENDSTQTCAIYTELINANNAAKKYKEGLDLFDEKATKGCNIGSVELFYAMYHSNAFVKDYPRAIKYSDKYIELSPNTTDGYFWKGMSQAALDTTETAFVARESFEKVTTKYEEKPDNRVKNQVIRAYNYLAVYYAAQNDIPKAKEYCQKVLALDPANKQTIDLLGQLGN